jgi:ribosomal protein S18 acetylase RimI-like enzyme
MAYRIEQALPDDLEEIMKIEEACFPRGVRERETAFIDRIQTFPEGNLVLLADDDQAPTRDFADKGLRRRLAGYFTSEIWTTRPLPARGSYELDHPASSRHDRNGSVLYVSSLAVKPAARGGAGRLLFTESIRRVLKKCPRVKSVVFIVNEQWLAARHIYETEGFRYTGKIDAFFRLSPDAQTAPKGENAALIMEKEL